MKNISIRSTFVLVPIAAIAIGLLLVVENTKKDRIQPYFQEKRDAAILMENCINFLKESNFHDEISIDNINDPNDTRIIGRRFSSITSGRGSLPIKLSTINPNFAALAVELFREANLKSGDHIAVCATGSFPGLNIAVLSAAEVLDLEVSFISSVTSSSWGANDPDYTFLDINYNLNKANLISTKIIASSIGANGDIGRTISLEGRDDAKNAINRNNIYFINGESLRENIKIRMDIFSRKEAELNKPIKLFVNIGGGVASLGSAENGNKIPSGLTEDVRLNIFQDKTGVMFNMASKNIPLINLLNLQGLMKKYGLPMDPVPLPNAGEGKLFYELKYDLGYVYVITSVLLLLIGGVVVFDKKQNALGREIIQNNTK